MASRKVALEASFAAGIELLGRIVSVLFEELAGGELSLAVSGAESVHGRDELVGPVEVNKAERTAPEGREAETEDGADVSIDLKRGKNW